MYLDSPQRVRVSFKGPLKRANDREKGRKGGREGGGVSSLLQDLGLCRLRESEIHHLVQQLVNDDEVVPDGLLFQLLEVFGEDGGETVKEDDDLGSV